MKKNKQLVESIETKESVETIEQEKAVNLPIVKNESKIIEELPSIELNPFYNPMVDEGIEAEKIKTQNETEIAQQAKETAEPTIDKDGVQPEEAELAPPEPTPEEIDDQVPEASFDPDRDLDGEPSIDPSGGMGSEPMGDGKENYEVPPDMANMTAEQLSKFITDTYCTFIPSLAHNYSKFDINNIKVSIASGKLPPSFLGLAEDVNKFDKAGYVIPPELRKYLQDSLIPLMKIKGYDVDPMWAPIIAFGSVTLMHLAPIAIKNYNLKIDLIKQYMKEERITVEDITEEKPNKK